jgi:anthrone oxygenase-like protein
MVPLLKLIAILSAAFFAGGGLFVSIVIYHAIMMDMASAVAHFGRIYNKAAPWQGSNAIICLAAAVIVSALSGDWWWAIGGLLVGASIPFTLLVMMPVNNRLLDEKAPPAPDEAVALLKRWGTLHWVRNVLSTLGLVVMLERMLY